jgi:methionine synthase II (cobalamin-independent)
MLETLRAIAAGQAMDMAAYEAALANHVADIVKKQVEAGIDTVTDGECSKPSFQQYVAERLAGFEPRMPAGGLGVPTRGEGHEGAAERRVGKSRPDSRTHVARPR